MGKLERIFQVVAGLLLIAVALILIIMRETGAWIVLLILSISLLIVGIRTLIYYFRMARHMVGGKIQLFYGVILVDIGIFSLELTDVPIRFIMIYLLIMYVFSGVILILRAFEAKKYKGSSWKKNLILGIINILVAAVCGVFMNNMAIMAYVYAAGLIYSGITRIYNGFRKTAIIYIQ